MFNKKYKMETTNFKIQTNEDGIIYGKLSLTSNFILSSLVSSSFSSLSMLEYITKSGPGQPAIPRKFRNKCEMG
jgi:hypothetical protein